MKFAVRNAFLLLAGLLPALLLPLPATPPEARAAAAEVRVLATTYPVYLLTRAVAQASPGVRVELLIPARTGCPHEYALTPGDVRRLITAKIVVINGLGMEDFLGTMLAGLKDATVIDSSAGVRMLRGPMEHHAEEAGGHGHDHAHGHGGVNPHAFSSPVQAAAMARAIGTGLAKAAPEAAGECAATAEAYAVRLEALGRRLAAVAARAANKDVLLLHDGMAYLVRDAGLHLAGVIQEDEDVQPSAARLLELAGNIRKRRPALLIGEPQYSDKPVRALAAETGVPAVLLDPVASGPEDAAPDYYERVMENNCRILEEHLGN
ncbi:MAG: zinc ABC transporter substrate-binding protein [Desulfovibrio desulfuricans]|jgi:zinc/manganese transport system substrate-binding protein/zinc transport system substrate-binding protein|nr:zinc ABC transporter substrate-binding protein [Desulfovibrio desulfuricans]